MNITNNPVLDEIRYSTEQEEKLKMLPICEECGYHIVDDGAYFINNKWFCENCIKVFWKWLN